MKYILFLSIVTLLWSCDSNRVFEDNIEFKDRAWKTTEPALFEFKITDSKKKYNVYYNIRNSLEYPYARIFVQFSLLDSANTLLSKKLVSNFLFDQKTGRPLGNSGIGDIFDNQFLLLEKQAFTNAGTYHIQIEQFNRQDTLQGVIAVGIRVETHQPQ